ncbi:XRE family transcriptional regulator [Escherichia coli]|nr:bacteriophage CI repressor [Escherichia coli]EFO2638229.1 XRE family transcriptional regulator [Escherichia coli]EFO2668895.1 XRE family transcriptional regulator [Escherichia coli]EFO2686051.1 XRE family transcriptional regulator [Escherichia coli]EFO2723868.1 XRE family transcriptional regulator [Escherichia coli]
MLMETTNTKNHRVSFVEGQKETFLARLRELVNGRPLQQAADDWKIPKSTLNNYFYRGSHPRIEVVQRIAQEEGVSMEWLLGKRDVRPGGENKETVEVMGNKRLDEDMQIISFLSMMSQEDKKALLKGILDIGIKGILHKIQLDNTTPLDSGRVCNSGALEPMEYPQQTKQADSDLDEQETAIRSLNIRESLKDAICMALAGNEETDKEILRRIESRARAGSPGGQTVATPEQETKPVSKKLT